MDYSTNKKMILGKKWKFLKIYFNGSLRNLQRYFLKFYLGVPQGVLYI